ncbi:MAG: response regulator [Planctomycetota bacterium]
MSPAPAARPRKRILTCDDEPSVSRLLQRFLRFSGFEVTSLQNPALVLGALEQEPYDLLILDLLMPELDGDQVLARLRACEDGLEDLPVIVLTAKLLEPEERAALRRLRATVLQKPFQLHDLIQRVRQAVSVGRVGGTA